MKKFIPLILLVSSFLLFTSCRNDTPPMSPNHPSDTASPSQNDSPYSTETLYETVNTEQPNDSTPEEKPLNYKNIKAMWLSQFDLQSIYTDNGKQREIKDFTERVKTVLENVKENGFNTVFLQIRPNCDSFYPSEYFPPSKYVTGSYSNVFSYDPVEITVNLAHGLGLSIHAWFNPLRAVTEDEIKDIDSKYLLKQWYADTEKYGNYLVLYNGRLYLNPAYEEVRSLIIHGITEIISKYPFDGVHNDDYFYPTTDKAFDKSAFEEALKDCPNLSLKSFRYNNLNKLTSGIYKAVKEKNTALLYGVSPEGNMSNALNKAYADVYTWCSQEGYIDYICPQIYFGLEHQTYPFDKTADNWENIIKTKNVKLIIGMTFGKALSKTDKWAGSGSDEWQNNSDVMKRCLEYTKRVDSCRGVAVFCYQYYYDPLSQIPVKETQTERSGFTPVLKDILWN